MRVHYTDTQAYNTFLRTGLRKRKSTVLFFFHLTVNTKYTHIIGNRDAFGVVDALYTMSVPIKEGEKLNKWRLMGAGKEEKKLILAAHMVIVTIDGRQKRSESLIYLFNFLHLFFLQEQ